MVDSENFNAQPSGIQEPQPGVSKCLSDEHSAAFNIDRSKQLIKTLEQTTRQSASVLKRAKQFYETCQLLETSRLMTESAQSQMSRSRRKSTDSLR